MALEPRRSRAVETLREIRYSLRALRRRPLFAGTILLTLGLGIGANTAIFSIVNAVLLKPLPFHEPDRLVRVFSAYPERDIHRGTASPIDLDDWRAQNDVFETLTAFPSLSMSGFVLTGGDRPEEVPAHFVEAGFFETLGVAALHGRSLQDDDHDEGRNAVVVLSHASWQRRLGGDPDVVGDMITLSGSPFTIIGVMPPGFVYPSRDAEMWVPLSLIPESGIPRRRDVRFLWAVGRLRNGVGVEQARTEMTTIAQRLVCRAAVADPDGERVAHAAQMLRRCEGQLRFVWCGLATRHQQEPGALEGEDHRGSPVFAI